MSTRKGKRYTTSYKEKQHPKQDPYAMLKAPKGPAMCSTCKAVYLNKRWYVDDHQARRVAASPDVQKLVCPACQKIRDGYPEGIVTVKWSELNDHEAEIRGLIAHVEARAISVNPLDRVMKIDRRRRDLEVQTTNDRLAQRLGRALVRAYKGKAAYKWAHRDMMVRVTWQGPERKRRTNAGKRRR